VTVTSSSTHSPERHHFFGGLFFTIFAKSATKNVFPPKSDKDSGCSCGICGPSTSPFRPYNRKKTKNFEIRQLFLRSDNYEVIFQKKWNNKGDKHQTQKQMPRKVKIWGTLVGLLWRAAAPGLQPLRLPRARNKGGRLGAGFISVCLKTRWLRQKRGLYVPEWPCKGLSLRD